ncbi:hypothetical protein GCM10025883_37110 [Mobilicoccus caccae]|uniref:Uncharacterized protein n=1 Tax=Mobilicoccus caccae TaxID=1859295 RepID=A0ABQ6IVM2_9MICO|nr:hypothetical protein GCM10025883_37110 [Mobilicoccus caccae]
MGGGGRGEEEGKGSGEGESGSAVHALGPYGFPATGGRFLEKRLMIVWVDDVV